jgi:hypothetical protein
MVAAYVQNYAVQHPREPASATGAFTRKPFSISDLAPKPYAPAQPHDLARQMQIHMIRKEAAQPMSLILFFDCSRPNDPRRFFSGNGALECLS